MWKSEEYGTGRCINCGYLGCRSEDMRISECYPVSSYARESGTLNEYVDPRPKGVAEIVPNIKTLPWCFVGKANLKNETDGLFDANDKELSQEKVCIYRIITKSRGCPSWYPLREFSSPKEQWEESVMLAMEQRQQKFEIDMDERRKEFDLKLFEMSRGIQNDSKIIVEKSDRFNRRMTWFFIALAALEVIGTILALCFPNGFGGI